MAQRRDPSQLSLRTRRDQALKPEVMRVFAENFDVYGVRKMWRQMLREGFDITRCTVERLMRELGLQGVIRGKPVRTIVSFPIPGAGHCHERQQKSSLVSDSLAGQRNSLAPASARRRSIPALPRILAPETAPS